MKDQLEKIEARLQGLIENKLMSLFPWGRQENILTRLLLETMQGNMETMPDGRIMVPGGYLLLVHPRQIQYWQNKRSLLDSLTGVLFQAGNEAGVYFKSEATIQLAADTDLEPAEIRFVPIVGERPEPVSQTAAFEIVQPSSEEPQNTIPINAFLIINGTQVFPLNQVVVNIGRRLDNHLVIDDPRISRAHAQLRAVRGRYVLFDLNSTGGTLVNNQRINQVTLNPGDVISLAGVPIIYGQDLPVNFGDTGGNTPIASSKDSSPTQLPIDPSSKS